MEQHQTSISSQGQSYLHQEGEVLRLLWGQQLKEMTGEGAT
jgi:hypothetical protein